MLQDGPFHVSCCVCVGWGCNVICLVVVLGKTFSWPCMALPQGQFCFADDCPLTRQQLSSTVQSLLRLAGFLGSCSGHSFWISDATTAVSWGLPVHLIKTLSHCFSGACQCCVHKSTASLGRVSSLLALQVGYLRVLFYLSWVPQVSPLGGCGLCATSPHLFSLA